MDSARASLPKTLHVVLKEIEREAGLIGTVLLAGPDITQGGNIYSITYVPLYLLKLFCAFLKLTLHGFSVHNGLTTAGNNFSSVYKDFKANVDVPFQRFAGMIFRKF